MNCQTARERLLEADLSELRGEGELALHLRTCHHCRQQARVILDQYAALRTALERQALELDPADTRWRALSPQGPAWRRWQVLLPLALAASLAVLVVARRPQPSLPTNTPVPVLATGGAGLEVQGPPGRTVAVFQTDNPNIVVIWSF